MNSSGNATFPPITCPVIFPGDVPGANSNINAAPIVVACVVNILSSFIATTANFLVMWAIKETPFLHTPSGVFLFVLALSDFAVGVFVQPLSVVLFISDLTYNLPVYCICSAILFPLGVFLLFASFLAITAISFDRYLVLALHLRYTAIITVSRVIKLNIIVFVFSFPLAVYFWFSKEDWFRTTAFCSGFILIVLGIIAILFCYCRIFTILRRHKKQIQNRNTLAKRINGFSVTYISKYRKSVLAILYVLGAMVLSYLPCVISFLIVFFYDTGLSKQVLFISGMVVLLNSSINPLFYCWRITEIRRFAITKLRRILTVSGVSHKAVSLRRVKPVNE